MFRFISFKMDDGFIIDACKAAAILSPDPASFFVVIGRNCRTVSVDHIELLKDAEFGSIEEWRVLAAQGHDMQPHSDTHADFSKVPLEQQMQ